MPIFSKFADSSSKSKSSKSTKCDDSHLPPGVRRQGGETTDDKQSPSPSHSPSEPADEPPAWTPPYEQGNTAEEHAKDAKKAEANAKNHAKDAKKAKNEAKEHAKDAAESASVFNELELEKMLQQMRNLYAGANNRFVTAKDASDEAVTTLKSVEKAHGGVMKAAAVCTTAAKSASVDAAAAFENAIAAAKAREAAAKKATEADASAKSSAASADESKGHSKVSEQHRRAASASAKEAEAHKNSAANSADKAENAKKNTENTWIAGGLAAAVGVVQNVGPTLLNPTGAACAAAAAAGAYVAPKAVGVVRNAIGV